MPAGEGVQSMITCGSYVKMLVAAKKANPPPIPSGMVGEVVGLRYPQGDESFVPEYFLRIQYGSTPADVSYFWVGGNDVEEYRGGCAI